MNFVFKLNNQGAKTPTQIPNTMEYLPYLSIYDVKKSALCNLTTGTVQRYKYKSCPTAMLVGTRVFTLPHLPDIGKMRKVPLLKPEGILNSTI